MTVRVSLGMRRLQPWHMQVVILFITRQSVYGHCQPCFFFFTGEFAGEFSWSEQRSTISLSLSVLEPCLSLFEGEFGRECSWSERQRGAELKYCRMPSVPPLTAGWAACLVFLDEESEPGTDL